MSIGRIHGFALITASIPLLLSMTVRTPSAADAPPGPVSWVSFGDSYASGEGIAGVGGGAQLSGDCARSSKAFSPLAASILRKKDSWEIPAVPQLACTGAVSADLFQPTVAPGGTSLPSQVEQARKVRDRWDVATLSIGGNDVGFSNVLERCLTGGFRLGTTWADVLKPGISFMGIRYDRDCGKGVNEMASRASLLREEHSVGPSNDLRSAGPLRSIYRRLVDDMLTDRGVLVVVGYPRLFAPTDQWPAWRGNRCFGVSRSDAELLNRSSELLDQQIRREIRRSGRSDRIVYVSRLNLFETGGVDGGPSRGLCGEPGRSWLNGLTLGSGARGPRYQQSFHPTAAGHEATAALVRTTVRTFGGRWTSGGDDGEPRSSPGPRATIRVEGQYGTSFTVSLAELHVGPEVPRSVVEQFTDVIEIGKAAPGINYVWGTVHTVNHTDYDQSLDFVLGNAFNGSNGTVRIAAPEADVEPDDCTRIVVARGQRFCSLFPAMNFRFSELDPILTSPHSSSSVPFFSTGGLIDGTSGIPSYIPADRVVIVRFDELLCSNDVCPDGQVAQAPS